MPCLKVDAVEVQIKVFHLSRGHIIKRVTWLDRWGLPTQNHHHHHANFSGHSYCGSVDTCFLIFCVTTWPKCHLKWRIGSFSLKSPSCQTWLPMGHNNIAVLLNMDSTTDTIMEKHLKILWKERNYEDREPTAHIGGRVPRKTKIRIVSDLKNL